MSSWGSFLLEDGLNDTFSACCCILTLLHFSPQNPFYDPAPVRAAHGTQEELHRNGQVSSGGGEGKSEQCCD